ncbi:MAG: metallophosphoesterase [Elusimicrobia bacterium CG_4_10_14_0_8_um_filter_37_32]|nr:MAG: metallophosphoesterase [Elusimicrobia bacterium CG02_land_8_20_14_3_00_37_13]PIZ14258.1 MAG: metallophosphoesterase [Elusimicrobia bacterium CG_4_10_14_0_8_um_filter_37_32]
MKYAIISDVHSNLEALQIVLEHIRNTGVDKVICLGDIVGYGPNPKECVDLVKAISNVEVVLGNHDAAIIDKTNIHSFNDYAKEAIRINKTLITNTELEYISSLKTINVESGLLFVHGSPRDHINEYLTTLNKLQENTEFFNEQICFVGHTHLPLIYAKLNSGEYYVDNPENNQEFKLLDDRKYIINTGSVGQPRDHDSRCCFLYYDTEEKKITYCRLQYNIESVQKKMSDLQLPEFLITRLSYGK